VLLIIRRGPLGPIVVLGVEGRRPDYSNALVARTVEPTEAYAAARGPSLEIAILGLGYLELLHILNLNSLVRVLHVSLPLFRSL
jgi:hypothetical protein